MSSVCVIGAGAAGLITAKTLLDDGFRVQVLTRDRSPGGIWAKERIYPGLKINNVHGEYRFSCLPMLPPRNAKKTGGRLSGDDMQLYMEDFTNRFIGDRIRYEVEILNIRRNTDGNWTVKILDIESTREEQLVFDKIVLCTGGCSQPYIPPTLSSFSAKSGGFKGLVLHSSNFKANLDRLLSHVHPEAGTIVVVGGGKSAQDITTYLVHQGRDVTMIFGKADAFLAAPFPLPAFIRKSRFLSALSPHSTLRTRLERFLHTTKIGSMITHAIWKAIAWSSFLTFSIPTSSPFRNGHSLFWGARTNDEGSMDPAGFFSLIKEERINVLAPARVSAFAENGNGVVLADGRAIEADSVILCTGFTSSWTPLFDEATRNELGLCQPSSSSSVGLNHTWDSYVSLKNPPAEAGEILKSASFVYRGLVPAHNLHKRDFAVNGAILTINNGYTFEVASHWISSYFLGDPFLSLPSSTEEALASTQVTSAWLKKRYPGMSSWANESFSSNISFFNYPQTVDELLEDMGLPVMRSGGNWLTWPFKVIDLNEIEHLHDERHAKRRLLRPLNAI